VEALSWLAVLSQVRLEACPRYGWRHSHGWRYSPRYDWRHVPGMVRGLFVRVFSQKESASDPVFTVFFAVLDPFWTPIF
jgi:hypothetical protein